MALRSGVLRLKARLRRFSRRHPWPIRIVRSLVIFMAAFGGGYGFLAGAMSQRADYNPQTFAIGVSFLFAVACAVIAAMSMRMRWMRKSMRKLALHNESLLDRNWELKEAEERARGLFESQSDLVAVRDPNGRLSFVNETFCGYAGKTRQDLLGTAFTLPVLEQGDEALETSGTRIHDQRIETAMGPKWIAWREHLVRSQADEPAEWHCVGRDVTDRTESERAIGVARDRAIAANRAKSKFLAVASHELRTPLNGIIGLSGLLLDTRLAAEQADYVRGIRTSGEALLSMVEELLDFSRIETGKIDFSHRPFHLGALIDDVVVLLSPAAQSRNIDIAAHIDEQLPLEVIGDATRLRQILLNLIGEAIKASPAGSITVSAEPGIWPDEICFMIFAACDLDVNERVEICDRVVRRMGGRLSLDRDPAGGASCEVSVPLRAADGTASGMTPPDLSGKAILIVAPQSGGNSPLARHLGRWGAQICETQDVCVAEALLPERSWHAILIDAAQNTESASNLCEAAKKHAVHRVALNVPAEPADVQVREADGFTARLAKPVRAASIAACLASETPSLIPDVAVGKMPVAQAGASGLSVLVAEDNEINALLMRSLLLKLGHQPVICTGGRDAFESWLAAQTAGTPYDMVLMDVQMPDLNGIDTTRLIRSREMERSLPHTKILALTANALVEDRYACFAAGMDGFLVKPLDLGKLREALASVTPASSAAA